jgi:glucose/mannose-6-phosphate isomerase
MIIAKKGKANLKGETRMSAHLDQQSVYSLDSQGMGEAIKALPQMLEKGKEIGERTEPLESLPEIDQIAFLGMGGSAISGDLIASLFADRLPLNMIVVRNYDLPAFLGKKTLYFAVSYSGDTEETLEACQKALQTGGQVVAVTSGGRLGTLAKDLGFPLLSVPQGLQPRAALGFLLGSVLSYLEKMNLVPDLTREWGETFSLLKMLLKNYSPEVPTSQNLAKRLAHALVDKRIIIFATPGIASACALRWKTQINENSKRTALVSFYPELDHNEIVALGFQKRNAFLLTLRDREEPDRIALRVALTTEIIRPYLQGAEEIESQGTSRLARLFSLVILGDFLSYYLALLRGIDPTPVEPISVLKKSLRERQER